jgi:hypothetical protein
MPWYVPRTMLACLEAVRQFEAFFLTVAHIYAVGTSSRRLREKLQNHAVSLADLKAKTEQSYRQKPSPRKRSSMSALGQKRTYAMQKAMSALPPIATAKADFRKRSCLLHPESGHVRCIRSCPLWAKSGHLRCTRPCPLWARSGRSATTDRYPLSALRRDESCTGW